ncbi:MAG TPA: hypothetical protein VFN97_27535 [Actinospica sp.]|nr:hypothetical protein [Actinospica sp.]
MNPTAATCSEASTLRRTLEHGGGDAADSLSSWVRHFLARVAKGECTPAAKLHPLGFHCIPVHRSDEFGLCVHGWLPGSQREVSPTSDMHMHTFDMISAVITGNVINKELDLVPEGSERYRIFEIRKDGSEDVDVFTDTGLDTAIREHEAVKVSAGEQYAIKRLVYHSADETVQNQDFTVTLMLAHHWDDGPQRTLVETARAGTIPLRYERTLLSRDSTQGVALDILGLL